MHPYQNDTYLNGLEPLLTNIMSYLFILNNFDNIIEVFKIIGERKITFDTLGMNKVEIDGHPLQPILREIKVNGKPVKL